MSHRLPGDEAQVALVRRQIDAVGRMDLDLLEYLMDECLAAGRAEPQAAPSARGTRRAAVATGGASAEELRRLEQQLADRLDERIRACAHALYQLTGGKHAAAVVGSRHRS